MIKIVNHAVEKSYDKKRYLIGWKYMLEKKQTQFIKKIFGFHKTLDAIKHYKVAIKGPLTTPTGGGQRSLNVRLRQELDLYVCQRPIKWFEGVPSPVITPELVNMTVFRENSEDIYSGIEWPFNSVEVKKVINFLQNEMDIKNIVDSENCGIGIKNMSSLGSKRLIKAALNYAIEHNRSSVTVVHKGNIMKYTEGAFLKWGIELIEKEYNGFYDKDNKYYKFKILEIIMKLFLKTVFVMPSFRIFYLNLKIMML